MIDEWDVWILFNEKGVSPQEVEAHWSMEDVARAVDSLFVQDDANHLDRRPPGGSA